MSLVDTTAWLVDIPSVTGAEERIATEIGRRLSSRHDTIVRVSDSLVVGERTGRPLVLLVGHLDTVPDQGAGPARIDGDRLVGLGTTDMKGGLAVMIHLLESDEVARGPFDVVGVFYEAEEGPHDQNGLEPILAELGWLAEAELAVVMEPSDREIQLGCNGVVNATVEFHGRSSHSARPWWGENAVSKAGEWLAELHRREPEPFLVDGLEFKEVVSVTMASGGIARNVIPDRFTLNLNYRFNPTRSMDEAVERLGEICGPADDVRFDDTAPAGPVEREHPLIQALHEASGAPFTAKQGWTDVARLGTHGITAVNFGPGETALAHRADESLRIDDLAETFAALSELLTG